LHYGRHLRTLLILALIIGAGVLSGTVFGSPQQPLRAVAAAAAALALGCFLAGWVSGDYSWVDRLWSLAPTGYAWVYASSAAFAAPATAAALLVTLWGARLTFNFGRRGGYTVLQDHRWPILRERIGRPVLWQLFNLGFISLYQHALLVLITLPLYVLSRTAGGAADTGAFGVGYAAAAIALLLFLAIETAADQQQWRFQCAKASGSTDGEHGPLAEDIRRGFLTRGLFRWSRHPNYFGELGVWWSVYALGAAAAGQALHWSGIGALLLTALFAGSTAFTESISAAKYPEYSEYRRSTSPIVPLPPKKKDAVRV
jgi:steroid 5-alpha reductase family enzyme